jgi:hypothetical protein
LVFFGRYRSVFFGKYHTITEGKICQYDSTINGFREKMAVVATGTICKLYLVLIPMYNMRRDHSNPQHVLYSIRCTIVAGSFWKSLGLWLGDDPAECTHTIGDVASTWFGRNLSGGWIVIIITTSCKCSFFYAVSYQEIAQPVAWWWPSRVYGRLPHTIGDAYSIGLVEICRWD